MTKRINNPLPYPYSQFFKDGSDEKNLECSEDSTKQISSNYNYVFIILIALLMLNSQKPIKAASSAELDSGYDTKAINENYYE